MQSRAEERGALNASRNICVLIATNRNHNMPHDVTRGQIEAARIKAKKQKWALIAANARVRQLGFDRTLESALDDEKRKLKEKQDHDKNKTPAQKKEETDQRLAQLRAQMARKVASRKITLKLSREEALVNERIAWQKREEEMTQALVNEKKAWQKRKGELKADITRLT